MDGKILVTIITVCYNSEKTIEDTIKSVLHQSYPNIEYIIVDGSSTDNTLGIIKDYRDKFHGRLKLLSEPDKGIYEAMNKGIDLASGDIIGILNSDDWYEDDAVETIVNHIPNENDTLLYGLLRIIENGLEKRIEAHNHNFISSGMIPHPTCFVPASFYRDMGKFDIKYRYSSDYDLIVRFFSKGTKFNKVDRIITNYRTGGLSLTNLDARIETLNIKYKYGFISKIKRNKEIFKFRVKKIFWDKL